ncbi:hypothetical protein [Neorhizobium vignae]|uniref:hypothetical protein n=1 Tax=Neorhizobium vignae TaxID=690585 RepID=UPI0012685E9D|nr:hypothetical protein [Neorhizobium vignae]
MSTFLRSFVPADIRLDSFVSQSTDNTIASVNIVLLKRYDLSFLAFINRKLRHAAENTASGRVAVLVARGSDEGRSGAIGRKIGGLAGFALPNLFHEIATISP